MKQKVKLCKECGEPFIPVKRQVFCNSTCKQRYYRKRDKNVTEIECEVCGEVFIPNHLNRKYCSDECGEEMDRIKRKRFMFKLRRDYPEIYYNDLGSRGTSTNHKLYRQKNGDPDFDKELKWLKGEKQRLGL